MLKKIKKLGIVSIVFLSSFSCANASEKMYIDCEEFNAKDDTFHIHIGNNVWLETNTVHRDTTGLYTFESSIARNMSSPKMEHERKWKCPYCYNYWPIGSPCKNPTCPSKYK